MTIQVWWSTWSLFHLMNSPAQLIPLKWQFVFNSLLYASSSAYLTLAMRCGHWQGHVMQCYSWCSAYLQIRIHLLIAGPNLPQILQIDDALAWFLISGGVFKRQIEIIFVHFGIWFQFLLLSPALQCDQLNESITVTLIEFMSYCLCSGVII